MAHVHEGIGERLRAFVEEQSVFFVGTAPLAPDGHVNISPKGARGSLAVLDEHTVAYLDFTGSGAESLAHLRENGRITLMWCSFGATPDVVRVHGRGEPVFRDDPRWDGLIGHFPQVSGHPGARAVVLVHALRVSDSCGYAVPFLEYRGERDLLVRYFGRRDEAFHADYVERKNAVSIDGLPAVPLPLPPRTS
ncbi:pyridoxamine 5'-phosphate oxidase family protein [Streptacidiphilus sp. ASG 303]|uniref:pyridoxamine 5'-phosphate oxidase family protein n=1 Tax=Streptacidiphilus sp. ASG 303 TaxID=2896847 RepID=UPI001E5513A4|nr:pyridoxamine 5'-phosphate oxidase family protein [Streptacidiphilus sp. ASG 303]MCD0484029.1 pyridoxamine 5'-phosphate oxidase family protein [Streptacidiphilus sp. ASG 303]